MLGRRSVGIKHWERGIRAPAARFGVAGRGPAVGAARRWSEARTGLPGPRSAGLARTGKNTRKSYSRIARYDHATELSASLLRELAAAAGLC